MDHEGIMQELVNMLIHILILMMMWLYVSEILPLQERAVKRRRRFSYLNKQPSQDEFLHRLTILNDQNCYNILRMNREMFQKFCNLLKSVGRLKDGRYCSVEEKVASFLLILGHHGKNRLVKFSFQRSGQTVSSHFHDVLKAVLRLHHILIVTPEPVHNDCSDDVWRNFQGCLGALDGTYIRVHVKRVDHPRYRNRKGVLSVNVLGVCDRFMRFTYVLTGWEGSAADSRVLRDAIAKTNGLQIPEGLYYLVDCGYANAPGCLAPFRSVRYHLSQWAEPPYAPVNAREFFNMKHSSARNVIERAFGLLKKRWAILRSPSFYPIDTQNDIVLACCLVHNFIRTQLGPNDRDFVEDESSSDSDEGDDDDVDPHDGIQETQYIGTIENTAGWTNKRENMANTMFAEWQNSRAHRHG